MAPFKHLKSTCQELTMNHHLNEFVTRYIAVVGATFMAVSFVAFVSIPYHLVS